jgi:hypothetical protein
MIEKEEAIHRAERAKWEFGPVSHNEWEQIGALIEGLMLYCEEINPEKLWNKVTEEVYRLHCERMQNDPIWLVRQAETRSMLYNATNVNPAAFSLFFGP